MCAGQPRWVDRIGRLSTFGAGPPWMLGRLTSCSGTPIAHPPLTLIRPPQFSTGPFVPTRPRMLDRPPRRSPSIHDAFLAKWKLGLPALTRTTRCKPGHLDTHMLSGVFLTLSQPVSARSTTPAPNRFSDSQTLARPHGRHSGLVVFCTPTSALDRPFRHSPALPPCWGLPEVRGSSVDSRVNTRLLAQMGKYWRRSRTASTRTLPTEDSSARYQVPSNPTTNITHI